MTQPNYRPEQLLPGGASPDRPDIARSAPVNVSIIESRWLALRQSNVIAVDPAMHLFIEVDVPKLLSIARAAKQWANANNAEKSRQGAELIYAALRGL